MAKFRLAIPQLIFTVILFTNGHVQITNRVASGYVLPYMLIANGLSGESSKDFATKAIVYWTTLYALIQGCLFASFLPPA